MPGPVFDSGLTRSKRTLLRSAIAAQFSDLMFANGGYIRAIKSIPRPLKHGGEDEIAWVGQHLQGQVPCIVIALGGKKPEPLDTGDTSYRGELEVALYVCSTNMRGYVEGRLETDITAAGDATRDPGIDTMLEHVEERLVGQALVLGGSMRTSHMEPESEDEVWTGSDATIWEQKYSVRVPMDFNPDRHIVALNTSIEDDITIHAEELGDPQNPAIPPQPPVANLEAP